MPCPLCSTSRYNPTEHDLSCPIGLLRRWQQFILSAPLTRKLWLLNAGNSASSHALKETFANLTGEDAEEFSIFAEMGETIFRSIHQAIQSTISSRQIESLMAGENLRRLVPTSNEKEFMEAVTGASTAGESPARSSSESPFKDFPEIPLVPKKTNLFDM